MKQYTFCRKFLLVYIVLLVEEKKMNLKGW